MDEMQEIINDFIVETRELLESLDQELVSLEQSPAGEGSNEIVNAIFRGVHTIKGASGFLGFKQLVEVAHEGETLLNRLRQGKQSVTPFVIDVILDVADTIKLLVEKVENKDSGEIAISALIEKVRSAQEENEPVEEAIEPTSPSIDKLEETKTPSMEIAPPSPEKKEEPEPVVKAKAPSSVRAAASPEKKGKIEQTIRVDTERLDDVMNLVGELVLERNRLLTLVKGLAETHEDNEEISSLSANGSRINLLTSDLQMAVMRTRMQPVKKVFSKFPRMVRDLARSRNKEIELVMEGEETELDKSVIEEIGDPLVHLIRNAADHGIGSPEERKKAGKEGKGTVKLSAYHEGEQIVIEIADDGKGIDSEKIKSKAVDKGVISEAEAERLSEKEALNLIFAPGFSTAETVTDISGRGVGMDVVKTNISKLNGLIDIETQLGKGSRFILKLPLTVAIIETLMVGVGGETFAIPLSSVIETIRVSWEDIRTINNKEVIPLRDRVLPVLRLSDEFDIPVMEFENRLYVVVIGLAEKRIGILVEDLFGQEEVLIKPLGDYLSDNEGVSGATITGDGKVVLILDVNSLIQRQLDTELENRVETIGAAR